MRRIEASRTRRARKKRELSATATSTRSSGLQAPGRLLRCPRQTDGKYGTFRAATRHEPDICRHVIEPQRAAIIDGKTELSRQAMQSGVIREAPLKRTGRSAAYPARRRDQARPTGSK